MGLINSVTYSQFFILFFFVLLVRFFLHISNQNFIVSSNFFNKNQRSRLNKWVASRWSSVSKNSADNQKILLLFFKNLISLIHKIFCKFYSLHNFIFYQYMIDPMIHIYCCLFFNYFSKYDLFGKLISLQKRPTITSASNLPFKFRIENNLNKQLQWELLGQ